MTNLDDLGQIKKFDKKNMAGSIFFLKDQVKSAWQASKNLEIPSSYKGVKNIVLAGMGGSALGPHIIRSAYDINVPFQIVHEYGLPSFVNEESLVIVSSYSGNTEETIAALQDGIKKKAKIIGISSGGVLIEELEKNGLPYYQIDTKYNPSQNPRMGLGFSIAGILGMLVKLGFVEVANERIDRVIKTIDESNNIFGLDSKIPDNEAKNTALELMEKIFIVLAGPFLAGNAHAFANQINESAKAFGAYFLLPEMNHHLLEGIYYPASLRNAIKFFTFDSDLYEEKIKIRMDLSKELLNKNKIRLFSYKIKALEKDLAAFEALTFSSWASFYMAIAYEENPGLIPNVDYFKEQLAKRSG
ncbi:MAG: SIS domain-containing protein [bacterium]|nr:SIS domain-containing protein [bacterium]